jgi:hypothetical protein
MSDFKDTLKDIKSRGYWTFHFDLVRPLASRTMSHVELQRLAQDNAIRLRGWDVPHVPTIPNERNDIYNIDNGIESWCNAGSQKEIWRIFFDGEFVFYVALDEDWYDGDEWLKNRAPFNSIQPKTVLNAISSVIYEVTEVFEFAKRLVADGFFEGDIHIHAQLNGVLDRRLVVMDPGRIPLNPQYVARQDKIIAFDNTMASKEFRANSTELAAQAILKVFHMFQWNTASSEQIAVEQEKLFKRQF